MNQILKTRKIWQRCVLSLAIVGGVCQFAIEGLAQADPARVGQSAGPAPLTNDKIEKTSLIVTSDYFIGPEDVLDITVWRNADLSKQVMVRPDGRISLPLIGDISAVGKTAAQLSEDISSKLKEYKENPQVSIEYGVTNLPCVLFLYEGKVVDKQVGAAPKAVYQQKIKKMLEAYA